MRDMTPKQAEVLAYIKEYKLVYGYPPTRTEISREFRWSSPNAAQEHLLALEKRGALVLTPKVARGIRVD